MGWLVAELMWGIYLLWLQAVYFGFAIGMIWSGNKLRTRSIKVDPLL